MSSILLKEIYKGRMISAAIIFGMWLIAVSVVIIFVKGCSPIEEKPRYSKLTSPWAGPIITDSTWTDTVKPKPINHRLILSGSDTTFRFLVFAIQNPLDVTPNQKTQLLNWINTVKQDTTYAKK